MVRPVPRHDDRLRRRVVRPIEFGIFGELRSTSPRVVIMNNRPRNKRVIGDTRTLKNGRIR